MLNQKSYPQGADVARQEYRAAINSGTGLSSFHRCFFTTLGVFPDVPMSRSLLIGGSGHRDIGALMINSYLRQRDRDTGPDYWRRGRRLTCGTTRCGPPPG